MDNTKRSDILGRDKIERINRGNDKRGDSSARYKKRGINREGII